MEDTKKEIGNMRSEDTEPWWAKYLVLLGCGVIGGVVISKAFDPKSKNVSWSRTSQGFSITTSNPS